ncbi:MAG: hypothetical protein MI807_15925, partial [Verrucomicrobiales bacterium]|nr:hypothetical protein [Verrucomicrobiales bacterium]
MHSTLLTLASLFLFTLSQNLMAQTDNPDPRFTDEDPLIWMEEVEGERALDWVRSQNKRSLDKLEADPVFAEYQKEALEILTSKERIPYGRIRGEHVYNFWQDEKNVRGLWRRTSRESYGTEEPDWETIIDFDKLAEEEGKNWVFKGSSTHHDKEQDKYYTLVSLSDGGKDAIVRREFNIEKKEFVEDGFVTPEAKQSASWLGPDEILIGTDWGEGSLTDSGYARILKKWKRGTPLESAETVLEVAKTDVAVWPFTIELEDGTILANAMEADTFFTSTNWWLPADGSEPVKYPIPPKSEIDGLYKGKLLISLKEDWAPEGQEKEFRNGDLVAFEMQEFLDTKKLPAVKLVFRPNETQAVNYVAVAKGAALLAISENVVGKILKIEPGENGWSTGVVELPGKGQPGVAFSDEDEEIVFLNYEDFLTPDSLLEYNSSTGEMKTLKSLPPKFDAEGLVV